MEKMDTAPTLRRKKRPRHIRLADEHRERELSQTMQKGNPLLAVQSLKTEKTNNFPRGCPKIHHGGLNAPPSKADWALYPSFANSQGAKVGWRRPICPRVAAVALGFLDPRQCGPRGQRYASKGCALA